MTKKHSNKKALVASFLVLALCFTSFLATTFAWFTDSVTSENNIIKSGNLDIELEYWNGEDWVDVAGKSDIITNTLWEPGVTEVAYLRVANAGSLAFKYQLGINIMSETAGVNVAGESFNLSDYIQFGVVELDSFATYTDREAALADVTGAKKISDGYTKAESMLAGEEIYLALVVYMPTTVGNVANHNGVNVPTIELGIDVFATQFTYEEDSFGSDYDKGAPWTGMVDVDWYLDNPDASEYVISSPEELAGFAAIVNGTAVANVSTYAAESAATTIHDNFSGKTVKLGGNINLNDIEWTPIGRIGNSSTDFTYSFKGNFDGQGYTVSGLVVSNEGWAGLFGIAHKADMANVTINGATIFSNRMAGALVGQLYGSIDNCHVKNSTIMVTPNAVGDSYDNGDKVGGIVGWLGDNGDNRTLTNCSAENVELGAYRDVGGIAGYVASSTTVKNNSAVGVKITVDQSTNYYGDKDVNAGYICGRVNGTITEENNTNEDSVVKSTYSKNGLTLKGDGDGNVTLYLVPESYAGDTVNVPEGITTIGNYAFAYNSNVETVVLASTVRDLGRGFDSSTVKKVVLNEGLTTISSRAFRSTTALEEVVFSSTVTEIADNAFQKSAIKEIVIPASVITVGETAFGASLIEKVTFEGNTAIQGYAFRGCTKLNTVILGGDDVTFIPSTLNGRNSCWFCNGESNNPNTSDITFVVKSEVIKERVLTAMGAEKNNTPVYIGVQDTAAAQAALDNAAPGTTVYLLPGVNYGTLYLRPVAGQENTVTDCDYLVYRNEMLRKVENLTIVGAPGATIDAIQVVSGYIEGSTGYVVDIKNLVIDSVEFTDDYVNPNTAHKYSAPLFFDLTYINVDGLTVKDCTLIGNNANMNFVYFYGSGNPSNSTFETAAKNITLSGNTVDGIARLCELRQTENVTIENNVIKNTTLHGMLLTVDGGTYSGNVTITGNTAYGINERFVRMAGAGDATVVIEGNTVNNYLGEDADYIKVTDGTNVTVENNTKN